MYHGGMSASIIVDRLDVFINYEDESPSRVAELIIDICEMTLRE